MTERDGAYVLGALSPVERQEYEQHLQDCEECARAVRELAGLPGLLARVDSAVLEDHPVEPLPETLLPRLVREVRRSRHRRTALAGIAAAAVVAAAVAVPVALSRHEDAPAGVATGTVRMQPVGDVPVHARLALAPVAWGTRLDLTCTYGAEAGYQLPRRMTYELVVRSRSGRTEEVGSWSAVEGRPMRVTAATALQRDQIASVQVRTTDGRPVLQLAG